MSLSHYTVPLSLDPEPWRPLPIHHPRSTFEYSPDLMRGAHHPSYQIVHPSHHLSASHPSHHQVISHPSHHQVISHPSHHHSGLLTHQLQSFDQTHQLQSFDQQHEMRRLTEDMNKMYSNMLQLVPAGITPGANMWLNEDFHMDNPIVKSTDGGRVFRLQFDVKQFKPEEIRVTTADNTLTVKAKHEEKRQNRSVYREYSRAYVLPEEIDVEALHSKLTKDGVLTIEAPLPSIEEPKDRIIAIEHN